MSVDGFNVGSVISLGDMDIAREFISNKKKESVEKQVESVEVQNDTEYEDDICVDEEYYEEEDSDYDEEETEDSDYGDEDSDYGDEDSDYGDEDSDYGYDEEENDYGDEDDDSDEEEDDLFGDAEDDFEDEEEDLFGEEYSEEDESEDECIDVEDTYSKNTEDVFNEEFTDEDYDDSEDSLFNDLESESDIEDNFNVDKVSCKDTDMSNKESFSSTTKIEKTIDKDKEYKKVDIEEKSRPKEHIGKVSSNNTTNIVKERTNNTSNMESKVTESNTKDINYYNNISIESLYSEVREFMSNNNVSRSMVNKSVLDDRFGSNNIKKLILKSYLIVVGKGVTIGR